MSLSPISAPSTPPEGDAPNLIFPRLSDHLRMATKEVHEGAMLPRIVHQLVSGKLPVSIYLAYLISLRKIYTALEFSLSAHPSHKHLASVYLPSNLSRASSLASDCEYFSSQGVIPLFDEAAGDGTETYIARLEELAIESDDSSHLQTLLLAHTYVRYLGDLSGGQQIARSVRKAYNLPSTGEGSSFYEFLPLPSETPTKLGSYATPTEARALKQWFRTGLDTAGDQMTGLEIVQVGEEAKTAFLFNVTLFLSFENRVKASEIKTEEKHDQWAAVTANKKRVRDDEELDSKERKTSKITIVAVGVAAGLSIFVAARDHLGYF